MNGIILPILLAMAGIVTALVTYSGIRRGGARFYTLEREAILRQASYTLLVSSLLYLGAVGLLSYQYQQVTAVQATATSQAAPGAPTLTATPFLDDLPPLPTVPPTVDPNIPTETATPVVCRGVIEGTSGNGLTMRDAPGGAEVAILAEGSILTILPDAPVVVNELTWIKIRAVGGDEGWAASDFITTRAPCGQP